MHSPINIRFNRRSFAGDVSRTRGQSLLKSMQNLTSVYFDKPGTMWNISLALLDTLVALTMHLLDFHDTFWADISDSLFSLTAPYTWVDKYSIVKIIYWPYYTFAQCPTSSLQFSDSPTRGTVKEWSAGGPDAWILHNSFFYISRFPHTRDVTFVV